MSGLHSFQKQYYINMIKIQGRGTACIPNQLDIVFRYGALDS